MSPTKQCLDVMLAEDSAVLDKSRALDHYMKAEANGSFLGIVFGAIGLFKLAEKQGGQERDQLEIVLCEIREYADNWRSDRDSQKAALTAQLRSLEPGTLIMVQADDGVVTASFVEMKRTRFVAELPDGQEWYLSLGCFVAVVEASQPA